MVYLPPPPPKPKGGGHIVFGADPVGVQALASEPVVEF